MAKASQAVILEHEFYIIKAPNGKVLEVKNFNTENGAAILSCVSNTHMKLISSTVNLLIFLHLPLCFFVSFLFR